MNNPVNLGDLTHNKNVTRTLQKLSKHDNFPNLLFYGIAGVGKHTRIRCFLSDLFGSNVHNLKTENREYKFTSKYVNVQINRSFYHSEITPSNYGVYDRVVVQEIIKEIAESPSVTNFTKKFIKVLVINQADNLTKIAQHALRRTMEKYSRQCRIILCCENYSKIISPLRSRCLTIRVAAPSKLELAEILEIPVEKVPKTVNIRKAYLMNLTGIELMEWEIYLKNLSIMVNSNESILKIREYFYNLLSVGIPDYIIFRKLTEELINLNPSLVDQIIDYGTEYQHRSIQGQKSIYHLEAFVAKVQSYLGN